MTRMEKRTCTSTRTAQYRRHLEAEIRRVLNLGICDAVHVTPDMTIVRSECRKVVECAAKLLRQRGFREVTIHDDVGVDGRWTACGV